MSDSFPGFLNKHCIDAYHDALQMCTSYKHKEVTVEHYLINLLKDPECDCSIILKHLKINIKAMRRQLQDNIDSYIIDSKRHSKYW